MKTLNIKRKVGKIAMKNYYELLEVNKKASKEVIEKAYKVLVKKYHPDLYTGQKKKYAEEKIKEINEAYSVLTDEFMREQYDVELEKQEQEALYEKYNQKENILNENEKSNISNMNQTSHNAPNRVHKEKQNNKKDIEDFNERMKKHKVGSFSGIIELCKELYKNKPKRDEIKEITKKDIIALILTVIVVILIGVALWYIPLTNGWMRELLFENPLFNAIASLFQ